MTTATGSRLFWAGARLRNLAVIAATLGITLHASAQFSLTPVEGLPAVDTSALAWADYDNDGDLDFLLSGTTNGLPNGGIAQLWQNTGGTFDQIPVPGLGGFSAGSVAWGDYDNDGRLDFAISGSSTNAGNVVRKAELWRNTTTGFSNVTAAVIPDLAAVNQSSMVWADFNRDGRLDLMLMGFTSGGKTLQLWFNTGTAFTNVTSSFAAAMQPTVYGPISIADYDNDGRIDILISGENAANQLVSQLWRNTESGFVNATTSAPGLPGVAFGSSAWGDFDRDGRLDFIISGESSTGSVAQVWSNTGSGFTNVPVSGLTGITYSSSAAGDFNNDGLLDFLLSGSTPSTTNAELWLNTGTGFTSSSPNLLASYSLPQSSAIADFDNDGRLDVLLTGISAGGRVTQLHRNLTPATNSVPPPPLNLTTSVSNGLVTFAWSAPADATSGTNLSFNVRIGTTPGASDILNAQADPVSGFRRLPAPGNAQLNRSLRMPLSPGVYYWSVQAVDDAYAGGLFAPEESFEVYPDIAPTLNIQRAGMNVVISWHPPNPGWILQETGTVTGGWSSSPSGSLNPVSLNLTNAQKFFRLHRP